MRHTAVSTGIGDPLDSDTVTELQARGLRPGAQLHDLANAFVTANLAGLGRIRKEFPLQWVSSHNRSILAGGGCRRSYRIGHDAKVGMADTGVSPLAKMLDD